MNRRDSVNHWSVLLAFLTDISSDTAWQISSNDISCETTCQISFNLYVSTLCGPLASLFKSCWFPNSSWFRESLKVLIRIFFKRHLLWNLLLDYFQIVFVNTFGGPLASLFKSCWFSDSGESVNHWRVLLWFFFKQHLLWNHLLDCFRICLVVALAVLYQLFLKIFGSTVLSIV